jgi:GNAT superfamily N-acetyltransferase
MTEPTIELLARSDVFEADQQRLLEMERDVDWGTPPGVASMQFGGPSDWRVLVRESGQVVSTVEILERLVLVGATELQICGIAGVMTTAAYQGRGHASAAMRRAAAFLHDDRDFAFALLVCWPSRVPFYERLSWRTHPGQVVCEQPGGQITIDRMRVMVLDGRQCPLPDARIDLRGLPW